MNRHLYVKIKECDLEIRTKQLEVRFNVTNKNHLDRYEFDNHRFLLTLEETDTKTGEKVQKYKYYDCANKQFVGSIREKNRLAYCHGSEFYKQIIDLIDGLVPEIHKALNDYVNGYYPNPKIPEIKIVDETMGGYNNKLCFDLSE